MPSQSLARNRPYHGLFRLSDDTGSGLVTMDTLKHTLNMLGAKLTQDETQMVADRLAARTDGLVDYEGLYRLLLECPPPQVTTISSLALAVHCIPLWTKMHGPFVYIYQHIMFYIFMSVFTFFPSLFFLPLHFFVLFRGFSIYSRPLVASIRLDGAFCPRWWSHQSHMLE